MGLDMYLYRITPATCLDRLSPYEESDDESFTSMLARELDFNHPEYTPNSSGENQICATIRRIMLPFVRTNDYINLEQIALDYELNRDTIYCSGMSSSDGYSFRSGEKHVRVPHDDIANKYTITKYEDAFAWCSDEIDYQRKGINDVGWCILGEIGNCSYSDDYDLVKRLVDEGGLSESFLTNWVEGETVFHPWW